jgi:putative inorganic carbon (HCO3(-)) transporter
MVYYGLLLAILLEYIRPVAYVPALAVLRLNSLVPLSAFAASILGFGSRRASNEEVLADPNTRFVLGILALLSVSVLTADVAIYATNLWTVIFGYVLLYWTLRQQLTSLSRMAGIFRALVLAHLIVVALNPQIFQGERQYITSGAFLGDGNDFALSVNVAIPLCLFLVFNAAGLTQRLFYTAALMAFVIAVVVTQSRGGTIALVAVGAYYWLKSDRKLVMASIAAVAVVVVVLVAPSGYFERMRTITDSEEGSRQGRIEAWKAAVRMAVDNPLLGVGAGHFAIMHGAVYRTTTGGPHEQTAHSIYFHVLGEFGLPGIALLVGMIAWNLRANRRLATELRRAGLAETSSELRLLTASSAALIAYAVGGAFLSAFYYPHLYVLGALLAAARHVSKSRLLDEPSTRQVQRGVTAPHRFVPRATAVAGVGAARFLR